MTDEQVRGCFYGFLRFCIGAIGGAIVAAFIFRYFYPPYGPNYGEGIGYGFAAMFWMFAVAPITGLCAIFVRRKK